MSETGQKKKILLAEDDQFLVRTLKEKLIAEGFEVTVAGDGAEAMAELSEQKPDIVLLDLMMPVKNGFDVLKEMKKSEAMKNIPVVILSNLGQESDIEKGRELGAVDYLVKAKISMREVVEKVRKYL